MVASLKFWMLLCLTSIWSGVRPESCARNELISTADCVCPGETFIYECSIIGGIFTVWTGSIIETGCEITLIHREYTQNGGARAVCNSGDVVGESISVMNDCYRSKLSVEVSNGINGSTVECTKDDGIITTLIGTETIRISTQPFPPPTAVVLFDVEPGKLTFTWTQPPFSCPSLTYNVITNNCGTCVMNSASANTTCTGFVVPSLCTIAVQSVICGNLASNVVTDENQLTVTLNAPDRPRILESIPYYSDGIGILLTVNTTWNILDPFAISDGIDGSTLSYTITYSDLVTNRVCSRVVVNSGSCGNGVCRHLFNTSTSECPTTSNLQISVFATNVLGNGLDSERVFQGGTNTFVDVKFNSTLRAVTCDFLNQPLGTAKRCIITIAYRDNCDTVLTTYNYELGTDSQSTPVIQFMDGVSEYCFTAAATSGNRTVIVEGTFNILSVNNAGVTTAATVIPIILVLVVGATATVIIAVLMWYLRKPSLVVIRFSNSDRVGSLAEKIKVFKEHGVSIITINRDPPEDDLNKRQSCCFGGSRTPTDIFVKICCSSSSVKTLSHHLNFKVEGYTSVDDLENTGEHECNFELQITLEDSPGSLWRILDMLERERINILGLNTQSNNSKIEGYKENFVYCRCSRFTLKKIIKGLKLAGALNVEEELHTGPSCRALQFYVRDEPGALVEALKAFQDLSINLIGLNPAFKELINDTSTPSGYRTIYVECDIESEKIPALTQVLKGRDNDNIIKEVSTDTTTRQGNRVIRVSIVDQVGSLVQTLELFKGVNILSVNSYNVDSNTQLRSPLTVEYKKIRIKFRYSSLAVEINEVVKDLHTLGSLTKVDHAPPEENSADGEDHHMIQFLARHRIGTLAQALQVFIDHKLNIVNVESEDVSENYVYVHNHVRFFATDHQESQIISKLYATGLVVEVDTFKWDKEHRQKMSKSPFQSRKGISLATTQVPIDEQQVEDHMSTPV